MKQQQPGTPGRTPSLFDKCTGFFYVRYTKHGTNFLTSHTKDEVMVKCLARGHKCHSWAEDPARLYRRTRAPSTGAAVVGMTWEWWGEGGWRAVGLGIEELGRECWR